MKIEQFHSATYANSHQIPDGTLQNFASNIKEIWETLLISIHPEIS